MKNISIVITVITILILFYTIRLSSKNTTFKKATKAETVVTKANTEITPSKQNRPNIFLSIKSPVQHSQVTSPQIMVEGTTVPQAEVFVNDLNLFADSEGNFSTRVSLETGENVISIVANDEQGNFVEEELSVTYNAPL